MITKISKKTITDKAKQLQKQNNLTYMQCLNIVAESLGFNNYERYKAMKKFKIAVYNQTGGVGKTAISINLAIDLNSDKYIRTDFKGFYNTNKNFIQLFPKIKEYDNHIPPTDLSVVYDLCSYTKFDKINNIINDINLFIIPVQSDELNYGFNIKTKNTLKKIHIYSKPIIILVYGTSHRNKKEDLIVFKKYKTEFNLYSNIHFIYLSHSSIYNDKYIYSNKLEISDFKSEYDLDTNAKSIFQIYNTSKRTKYLFKSIYNEYSKLLLLINDLLEKDK